MSIKQSLLTGTGDDGPISPEALVAPAPTAPAAQEWLRLEAAVREYPFSRASLYRLSALGHIEILKLGSRSIVRRTDLDRLLGNLPRLHPRSATAA